MLSNYGRSQWTVVSYCTWVIKLAAAGGLFNYPRDEHHLNINVNDEVIVAWSSDFADELLVLCTEGSLNNTEWDYTYHVSLNGTQNFSPIQLARQFDDWSIPAGCKFRLENSTAGGYLDGATIGVSSVATQPASVYALAQTVALDPSSTSSAISTTSASTLTTSASTSISSASPTTSATSASPAAEPVSNGLSSGAKAAIGVGTVVGVLLVGAVAFLVCRNRQQRKALENRAGEYKPAGVAVAPGSEMAYREAHHSGVHSSPHPPELANARG